MEKTKIPKKNPDVVVRQIDDEVILIPLYKTSDDIDCIYTLNDIAAYIWELIDSKRTLAEVRSNLLGKFDVSAQKVDKELTEFLRDLEKIKAIT